MGFKGIYANKSSASKVGILFLLMSVSVILHIIIATVLVYWFTDIGFFMFQKHDLSNQANVNYLKLLQIFTGVGLFITPTLFYAYLTNFDFKFTKLSRQNAILVIAIMLVITPFVGLLLEWNIMLPTYEWLPIRHSGEMVEAFLKMGTVWDLFYTILVIAVVPAIGEELLFRGYLQQKLGNWLRNPHTTILITAFLFSAIHFHFQSMIPTFVLGVLLGYLFYWSNSLWLPILAHFVNNAQVVLLSYPSFKIDSGAYSVSPESSVDPMMAIFSLVSVALLLYVLHQNISIKKG